MLVDRLTRVKIVPILHPLFCRVLFLLRCGAPSPRRAGCGRAGSSAFAKATVDEATRLQPFTDHLSRLHSNAASGEDAASGAVLALEWTSVWMSASGW